jgi:hypothetical protein
LIDGYRDLLNELAKLILINSEFDDDGNDDEEYDCIANAYTLSNC